MSMKTYVEAIEYVLDSELDARSDLICLRPGARRALEEADRDLPLPRMGRNSVWVALGAALQGMHPVLDLRQENGAAEFLREALMELPGDAGPAMTVILCAGEGAESLPGAYVFAPKTPRQAAGFMRSALKMNRLTLLLADQTLFAEEDDIPEDRGFTLLPLDGEEGGFNEDAPEEEETGAKEACVQITDEADAYDEAEEETVCGKGICEEAAYLEAEAEDVRVYVLGEEAEGKAPCVQSADEEAVSGGAGDGEKPAERKNRAFCAARQTKCDLTALRSLCALLEMDEERLIERCAGHVLPVYGGFELHTETDAPAGEAAFIPPEEENASLWLGGDMLTVSYDPVQMAHGEAAALLREVKRVVEKPQLLIYDKEYDEA